MTKSTSETSKGILSIAMASTAWGLLPLYWKLLSYMPLVQVMAYRLIFAWVFLTLVQLYKGERKLASLFKSMTDLKQFRENWQASLMLGLHWTLIVWGVVNGQFIEVTLASYLTPLVVLIAGAIAFKETITPIRAFALAMAALGVAVQCYGDRGLPALSIAIAFSFGLYGLLRKRRALCSVHAVHTDCFYLLFPTLILAGWQHALIPPTAFDILPLIGAGILTGLPMVWYASSLKRLPMSRLGFFQYISPTLQFFIALQLSTRAIEPREWFGFSLIWLGSAALVYGAYRGSRTTPPAAAVTQPLALARRSS